MEETHSSRPNVARICPRVDPKTNRMRLALILTPLLALTALAANADYWPSRLNGHLLEAEGLPKEVAPNKITALYMSASWCGPCKQFTPRLTAFRDQYAEKFQFVLLSHDRSLPDQLKYLHDSGMRTPSLAFDNKEQIQMLERDAKGSGIPQLLIYGEDGVLITNEGRGLIEKKQDPKKPRDWGNRHSNGYKQWEELLKSWHKLTDVPEVTPAQYQQALQEKYGSLAYWPIYLAVQQKPAPGPIDKEEEARIAEALERRAIAAGESVAKSQAWEELMESARLIAEGNPKSGRLLLEAYRKSAPFFRAAGALAAGNPSFRESCRKIPPSENYTSEFMLHAMAAAAAKNVSPEDSKLFWEFFGERGQYDFEILEPLLLLGDPKAYEVLESYAKRGTTFFHLLTPVLDRMLQAGRKEPLAVFEILERNCPPSFLQQNRRQR